MLKKMIVNYNFALILGGFLIAAYFGFLFFAKRNKISIHHQKLQMPFFLVYIVIGGLALSLYSQTRPIGMNILFAISPLFFFQGISIIDFYWRDYFKKSKFLTVILIITFAFNTFMLLLIMLMGLIDIWLNFRKIYTQEEIYESYSN